MKKACMLCNYRDSWRFAAIRSDLLISDTEQGRFRWLPLVSRGTAENSVVSHGRTRGADGNIKRACVVRYFRQKHDGRNHYETNNLCKSCNSMIVSFAHFILIIKHVL